MSLSAPFLSAVGQYDGLQMSDFSELKADEERKRDRILRRDPEKYWRDINAWLNKLHDELPTERRRDTPRACKLNEARILANMNRR